MRRETAAIMSAMLAEEIENCFHIFNRIPGVFVCALSTSWVLVFYGLPPYFPLSWQRLAAATQKSAVYIILISIFPPSHSDARSYTHTHTHMNTHRARMWLKICKPRRVFARSQPVQSPTHTHLQSIQTTFARPSAVWSSSRGPHRRRRSRPWPP